MSTEAPARPFRAARGVAQLAGVAAFGVTLSALYAGTGVGLPCPFRMATGWECPLCGGTRLGSALLHGDLVAAFAYNPVVLVGLVVLAVLGVLWSVEALGGPAVRLPARAAAGLIRVRPTRWLLLGLLGATVFVVLRNLL
ncbi:DUF2752 domain-containing protein [Friedmanniella luteola]|uniref:DUF2752 domain-containing protein n=1 Tax=Friedmanniella luteola TaxID=546871 RepID=UPI0018D33AA2|nr:DUF2752 domain-containing protein [Friedmanniella luteola]